MPSSHLILCCPLLLLPPIPPSIRGPHVLFLPLWYRHAEFSFPPSVGVQLLSHVRVLGTPGTAAHQASLSFTTPLSLLKLMSVDDDIQPSHPLSPSFPFAFCLSQHQGRCYKYSCMWLLFYFWREKSVPLEVDLPRWLVQTSRDGTQGRGDRQAPLLGWAHHLCLLLLSLIWGQMHRKIAEPPSVRSASRKDELNLSAATLGRENEEEVSVWHQWDFKIFFLNMTHFRSLY